MGGRGCLLCPMRNDNIIVTRKLLNTVMDVKSGLVPILFQIGGKLLTRCRHFLHQEICYSL